MFGIDVSHHQTPALLPWSRIALECEFIICRATYGTMRDRQVHEHFRRARVQTPSRLGCYHFWRASQPMQAQLDAFFRVADLVGLRDGDILPCVDIEDDVKTHVTPEWAGPAREFVEAVEERYGGSIIYITQRDWGRLGKPAWVLDRPLWVAHYTSKPTPATPANKPWAIWQHRVGPLDPDGPGGYDRAKPELDQNRARELPRIGREVALSAIIEAPELSDDRDDWALLRAQVAETNDRLLHEMLDPRGSISEFAREEEEA